VTWQGTEGTGESKRNAQDRGEREMPVMATTCQVLTESRVRMLWLVHARGYRVSVRAEVPRERMLGGIRYVTRWRLAL